MIECCRICYQMVGPSANHKRTEYCKASTVGACENLYCCICHRWSAARHHSQLSFLFESQIFRHLSIIQCSSLEQKVMTFDDGRMERLELVFDILDRVDLADTQGVGFSTSKEILDLDGEFPNLLITCLFGVD